MGDALWAQAGGYDTNELFLIGEVLLELAITNSITNGFNLVSYPYPVELSIRDMGFEASVGDTISLWNGATYDTYEYKSFFELNEFIIRDLKIG